MFRSCQSLLKQNSYFISTFAIGIGLTIALASIIDQKKCVISLGSELTNANSRKIMQHDDIYEPKINLAAKPRSALKEGHGMIRPRFHKAELGVKNKLFVGVLTSPESIASLAVAFNKTVSKFVNKIIFFIDAPSAQRLNVSMLKLPGIVGFTDTRKVLKPFHLIKYVGDNFLEDYDFFFIIRDTSYVQANTLNNFVKKISIKHDIHVGRKMQDISSEINAGICSLDFGILLSNSVLKKVHKSLEWCVKHSISKDDSTNVGQCIIHSSQAPCSESVQGSKFHTHKLKKLDSVIPTVRYDLESFERSIVVAPLTEAEQFFKIHFYSSLLTMENLNGVIENLRTSVMKSPNTKKTNLSQWPKASQPPATPLTHFDVLKWDHFNLSYKYLGNDFMNLMPLTGADKEEINRVVSKCITLIENNYYGALMYFKFLNGYQRFDPSRGMDYIIDLAFRETTSGKTIYKRLQVFKSLGKVEMVPVPYVTENVRVHLIIPVTSSDIPRILIFLKQYSINAMEKKDLQFLMLVFIYGFNESSKGEDDVFKEVKNKSLSLSNKFEKAGNLIKWHSIKLPANITDGTLMDFVVLDSVLKKFPAESLILFGRPNMEVRLDYFNKVRMNTVLGFQIFSPIPFSEYHPEIVYNKNRPQPPELDINKNYGHYDSSNFKHISFYTVDYFKARKQIESLLPLIRNDKDIWKLIPPASKIQTGSEFSVSTAGIYNMFLKTSKSHILRATEPSLRLRYPLEECLQCNKNNTFDDYCTTSEAFNLATRNQLGRIMLDYKTELKDLP